MIAYIKGALAYTEPEEGVAVLESGGIGYRILLSGRDLDLLPPVGEELRLYTHLQVREDAFVLFGFFTKEDRKLFQQLLGVNGHWSKGGPRCADSPVGRRFAFCSAGRRREGHRKGSWYRNQDGSEADSGAEG